MARLAGHVCVGLLRLIRAIPLPVAMAIGKALSPLYPALRPRHARNLRRKWRALPFAHGLTLPRYYRKRMEIHLVSLRLHGRPLRPDEVRVTGEEYWLRALGSGRPVVLAGIHLGPIEYLHRVPLLPEGEMREFLILAAPAFSAPLSAYMRRGREMQGKQVVWNRDTRRALSKTLRENAVLALMLDQRPGSAPAEERLRLFGTLECPFNRKLILMLLSRGAVIVPMAAGLLAGGAVRVSYHAPLTAADKAGADLAAKALAAFAQNAIRLAPEQWNWSYPGIRVA